MSDVETNQPAISATEPAPETVKVENTLLPEPVLDKDLKIDTKLWSWIGSHGRITVLAKIIDNFRVEAALYDVAEERVVMSRKGYLTTLPPSGSDLGEVIEALLTQQGKDLLNEFLKQAAGLATPEKKLATPAKGLVVVGKGR